MTYQKTLLTVAIETKSGGSITVADTAESAVGTAAWNAITHGNDVLYKDGDDFQFIAHDCICSAKATPTQTEVTVEDDNCNYTPCGETAEEPTVEP